jgi:Tat protein secretion system quality control protein TatD with DNase activity
MDKQIMKFIIISVLFIITVYWAALKLTTFVTFMVAVSPVLYFMANGLKSPWQLIKQREVRTNLAIGIGSILALACTSCGTIHSGQFSIVDAHAHIGASFKSAAVLEVMDENRVSKQIVMARHYPGPAGNSDLPGDDELALKLAEAYPGRFYPLVGMQRPLLTGADKWTTPDAKIESLIRETESKLASGKFFGIGEFIVRHWAYSSGRHAEQDNPIYSELMQRFSVLAARYDVPLVIHMEGYPTLVADFSRLMSEHSSTRYVWAHNCGRSKAMVIRSLLSRFPNLFCDLGSMTNAGAGYGTGFPRMEEFTSLIEYDGVLVPEMKSLYEEFADRFMVGMDVAHAPSMKHYARRVQRFRELLEQLSPEAREKIAEQNAIRIYRLAR